MEKPALSVEFLPDPTASPLLLTYRDGTGVSHTLRLLPKKPEAFIRSLGVKIED